MQERKSNLLFLENSRDFLLSPLFPSPTKTWGIEARGGKSGSGKQGQTWICYRPSGLPVFQGLYLKALKSHRVHVHYLTGLPSLVLRQKPLCRLQFHSSSSLKVVVLLSGCITIAVLPSAGGSHLYLLLRLLQWPGKGLSRFMLASL